MSKTVLLFLIGFCISLVFSKPADMYTTEYDHIDVEEILSSKRLLKMYVNCIMETGKCTKDGEELKKNIREAMETRCAKCSDKQKENAKKAIKHFSEKEPEYTKQLREKYDPTGTYYEMLLEEVKNGNLDIKTKN